MGGRLKSISPSTSKAVLVVSLLVIFWAIAVASRLLWNGDVYGLDFRNYHPDGVCYSQFAFDFAGESERGLKEIFETYQRIGSSSGGLPSSTDAAALSCTGIGLEARVLYPLLSVPFVKILGLPGMLVIPALSWLLTILVPVGLLVRRGQYLGPAIAGGLAIASVTLSRWGVANIVDPLLMALVASTLLFLPIFRPPRKWDFLGLALLAVAGALTRQSFPIWIAIALGPWIAWLLMRRNSSGISARGNNPWTWPLLVLTSTSLASWTIVRSIFGAQNSAYVINNWIENVKSSLGSGLPEVLQRAPSAGVVPSAPSLTEHLAIIASETSNNTVNFLDQLREATFHSLSLAYEVLYTEFGQLFVLDRALVILLALAIFGAWHCRAHDFAYMFPAMFLVTLALGAVNSTVGVNFRFQLSTIPFAILMAALAIDRLSKKQKPNQRTL